MLTVRRASERDVDALVPLKAAVHALHVARRPDMFKSINDDEAGAWLRARLADQTIDVWMAQAEGRAVGYVTAVRHHRAETIHSRARQWCELDEISVAADHRQRGVARALVEQAVEHARSLGLEHFELSTWAFNAAARAAFERVGFEPMQIRYERRTPPPG